MLLQSLAECEKIVRRIQFEKAIESESPPSAWEGFDLEDLGNTDFSLGTDS